MNSDKEEDKTKEEIIKESHLKNQFAKRNFKILEKIESIKSDKIRAQNELVQQSYKKFIDSP